jgi:Tol biopolymer transport system component
MDERPGAPEVSPQTTPERGSRLDSWKEIAAYLNRDLRTLQRWEKTANLPIRRLNKPGMRAVFAYTADLDEWLRQQSPDPPDAQPRDRPAAAAGPGPVPPQARRGPARAVSSALVILVALAAVAAFLARRGGPPPFEALTARPITADPGSERDPDISPDGKAIAYVSVAPDLRTRIQIRMIDGGEPHALTATSDNEWSPVWSPDGARLAFLRGDPAGAATVFTISRLGGEERKVADVRPYPRRRTNMIGHLLAWTPDGRHVIVPERAEGDASRLFLIDTTTAAAQPLTSPAAAEFDVEPSISSDGRLLLFNRVRGEFQSDVFVQRLGAGYKPDGPPRKLPSTAPWNGTPKLLEQRGEVLTSAGNIPRLSLWRQPLDGSAPPVSLGIIGDYATQSAVHQASGRIVSRTYRSQSDVLRFALPAEPAATAEEPPVQAFLESTFIDRSPAYSPDGSRIAFISDRTGHRQLWVASGDGQRATEWNQAFEADLPAPSWSPDNGQVAFTGAGPSGWSQVFVVDAATRVATPLTHDALEYGHTAWSPGGRFLYAAAADRSVYGIYRVPAAGGAAELVLPGYRSVRGLDPAGAGLYVTRTEARNQNDLYYVPLPKGPAVHLASMNFSEDAWVTPKGVYYMARRADRPLAPVALYFRTHDGVVTLLQEYTRPPGRGLSVSADGRYAITTRVVPPISDLLLLETTR